MMDVNSRFVAASSPRRGEVIEYETLQGLREVAARYPEGASEAMRAFTDPHGVHHIPSRRLAGELGLDYELVRAHEEHVPIARELINNDHEMAERILEAARLGDTESVKEGTVEFLRLVDGAEGFNEASVLEEVVTHELALQSLATRQGV